jgi:regulator of sigma E protease
MPDLSSAGNLLLVVIGFGALILVHELGHFLAARWAGVRVHEFAIGFGSAICSWRKGYGFTLGSSEHRYNEQLKAIGLPSPQGDLPGVSPTEYRLNWIPFGGYVRMLGQDDANPGATSAAPDSYASQSVLKRMGIISAGVIMNIITAAALFIVVFMNGLKQPAPVLGFISPDFPASHATPIDNDGTIAPEPGLQTGDRVLTVNDNPTPTFGYVQVATAMARAGSTLRFEIEREGFDSHLLFDVAPQKSDDATRGMQIGVGMGISNIIGHPLPGQDADLQDELASFGLKGLEPGDTLVTVNNKDVSSFHDLHEAFKTGNGQSVAVSFQRPGTQQAMSYQLEPVPLGMLERVNDGLLISHLLGFTPPVVVGSLSKDSKNTKALTKDDILTRIGNTEWPSFQQLRHELDQHKNRQIEARILRDGQYVSLPLSVSKKGTIGFTLRSLAQSPTIVTSTLQQDGGVASPADAGSFVPGSRILAVNGTPVSTFADLRKALRAHSSPGADASYELTIRLPIGDDPSQGPTESVQWNVPAADIDALHALGWESPVSPYIFEPETIVLKAQNPLGALNQGIAETKRIITLSYLTLLRFVQGSVHIEQFKGPVGIAHIGTQIARDGFISLLFFLAVISTNLAVLNFLPLPIVDGGHMVYLIIEGITGKPVSVVVQNLAAMAGILVLASFFLLVTFNDIKALLGA